MADETDVPPLEDMSDMLQKVQIIKEKRTRTSSQNHRKEEKKTVSNGHCTVSDKNIAPANKPAQIQSKPENTEPKPKPSAAVSQSSSGFGGMKKGFMFGGGSSQPKPSQEKTKEASVPYVKKNEESLKLDEVQQAMSDTITSKKDEWMTEDLLSKVEKNETLLKKLQDPRFMEAVNMFQTNPTAAMERYKNDKETQEAFMQFCGLMGNHFTNIADKDGGKTEEKTTPPQKPSPKIIEEIDPTDSNIYNPTNPPSASQRGTILTRQSQGGADMSVRSSTNPKQATAEDENKMQDILSQPDVMDVLMDPWIQNLFHVLRNDPGSGQRMLLDADGEKKKKIKKLVDVGMLQFQT